MGNLGERIRYVREKKLGLNQQKFAKLLGFSRASAVSKYELNQREPEINILIKIANVGQEGLDWLLTGTPPEKPPYPAEHREITEKLVAILEKGDPETRGFVKGVLESEYRKLEKSSKEVKKGA